MINIIKEFVEKRIGKEEDCFLIIFYHYQTDIYNENNTYKPIYF
jgi:hypothetical protein